MIRIALLLMLMVASLSGCENCHPDKEPFIRVNNFSSVVYKKVYGYGKQDKLIKEYEEQGWDLPISLVDDQISFVFETQDGKKEMLSFSYSRQASVESNRCGVRVFFKNLKLDESSTFGQVYFTPEFDLVNQRYYASIEK